MFKRLLFPSVILALISSACVPTEPSDTQSTQDLEADQDQDGYPASEDCNDLDASIHPGADDTTCDGIDQDCNGNEDGLVTFASDDGDLIDLSEAFVRNADVSATTIDNAGTLQFCPGEYWLAVTLGSDLNVTSLEGPATTTLRSVGDQAVFTTEGPTLHISGLTFVGGSNEDAYGGIVRGVDAEVTVIDSVFRDGVAEAGGALHVSGEQGRLEVRQSTFEDFSATVTGGAIYTSFGAELMVDGCTFIANTAGDEVGGAISMHQTQSAQIQNSSFTQNVPDDAAVWDAPRRGYALDEDDALECAYDSKTGETDCLVH